MSNPTLLWFGPNPQAEFTSPAASRWQLGLLSALAKIGVPIEELFYNPAPAFPRGPLRAQIGAQNSRNGPLQTNVPVVREHSMARGLREAVRDGSRLRGGPDAVITYNPMPSVVSVLRKAKRERGVRWVCLFADRSPRRRAERAWRTAERHADVCVYLSWYAYMKGPSERRMHMEGGTARIGPSRFTGEPSSPGYCRYLYAGTLGPYGGADSLILAFRSFMAGAARLTVCGHGDVGRITDLAAVDHRIRVVGMVDKVELDRLVKEADVCVNPRPLSSDNDWNFPSKTLLYIESGKPVLSTPCASFAPAYRSAFHLTADDSVAALLRGLRVMQSKWRSNALVSLANASESLAEARSWELQAQRLCEAVASTEGTRDV